MRVLVTGAAGFIGFNLVLRLVASEPQVEIVGVDSMNDYYDIRLKEFRLDEIRRAVDTADGVQWRFVHGNIADRGLIDGLFEEFRPQIVVNLTAQAGVLPEDYDFEAHKELVPMQAGDVPVTYVGPGARFRISSLDAVARGVAAVCRVV